MHMCYNILLQILNMCILYYFFLRATCHENIDVAICVYFLQVCYCWVFMYPTCGHRHLRCLFVITCGLWCLRFLVVITECLHIYAINNSSCLAICMTWCFNYLVSDCGFSSTGGWCISSRRLLRRMAMHAASARDIMLSVTGHSNNT